MTSILYAARNLENDRSYSECKTMNRSSDLPSPATCLAFNIQDLMKIHLTVKFGSVPHTKSTHHVLGSGGMYLPDLFFVKGCGVVVCVN